MVHIKRVELTNFKSFGGTTEIPLLPGFTVVSGPNGSGKSNILDALLFALGLSSSKGMRAERLPDLVNNTQSRKTTVETRVTVTFDLSEDSHLWSAMQRNGKFYADDGLEELETDQPQETNGSQVDEAPKTHVLTPEWTVTRKLRVTKQGTYTSTYYINGEACTQTELHEQLNHLRVYPEGYNVVLQGDVTSIITMKPRERREIIDELAGVAQFDRKISLAKEKLDTVKEREERSRIVEQELIAQRDRLNKDRVKAEKYQKLRDEFQEKTQWEAVLNYQTLQKQTFRLREQIEAGDRSLTELSENLNQQTSQIQQSTTELEQLNARVKAMGEQELIDLQTILAKQEAEYRQFQQRQRETETAVKNTQSQIQQTQEERQNYQQTLETIASQRQVETHNLQVRTTERDHLQYSLNQTRQAASQVAQQAEAWMQQQTDLHHQIETLQKTLNPQRTEQAKLTERVNQLQRQINEQQQSLVSTQQQLETAKTEVKLAQEQRENAAQQTESLVQIVAQAEQELQLQQDTQTRLLREQREAQRQLDKLEAQQQAQQEATGSYATKVIAQSGLPGVCGLVCQLGRVEPDYQLALEIAAGGRLGNLVVEDDGVAAAGIELLKRQKAGRITFLPLNKIRPNTSGMGNLSTMRSLEGFIDLAVNLIECDRQYENIFAYVFGNTMVFNNLNNARRYIGQHRMVTLDGELLEPSGAMTGGSQGSRSTLHFGTLDETTSESQAIANLRQRLDEIERILERCMRAISDATITVKDRSQALIEARQTLRDNQQKVSQIESEIKNSTSQQESLQTQLNQNIQELNTAQARLQILEREIPFQEKQLERDRENLSQLEAAHSHSEWQQLQTLLRSQETDLQAQETALQQVQQRLIELDNQQQRIEEKIEEGKQKIEDYQHQQHLQNHQIREIKQQITILQEQMAQTQASVVKVEARLGEEKQQRDQVETRLREQYLAKQQLEWQIQKLQETQQGRREQLTIKQEQLTNQKAELSDPLPEIPENLDLASLQRELKALQKQMEALEPVNMLALEEYERTQTRLEELTQKLATLEGERTELLLRIENFTTLRQRAFQEAFDAVNENFKSIFADLSDGDGYLQIDDPEDPFNSGLNLIAHPKGKPVQRLASMSGGEKSLTALSFIFSLQRYRPSPFYAFDEVDMFLDGANVERLARMIKRQAQQAQFIVVSLRRPMMEASERTIGVTQARGAYTQVLGIKI
jgi:chromosome segregation protein